MVGDIRTDVGVVIGSILLAVIWISTLGFDSGVLALGISIFNTIYMTWRHHVRGPQFTIVEARFSKQAPPDFLLAISVKNVGDRTGYMRWTDLCVKLGDQLIYVAPGMWEWEIAPDTQITENQFHFSLSKSEEIDLTKGMFIAEGRYSNHKGRMCPIKLECPLTKIW